MAARLGFESPRYPSEKISPSRNLIESTHVENISPFGFTEEGLRELAE